MTTGTHLIQPGQIIDGKYRIVRELAAGGMGVVFEAEHLQLGTRCAVKVMLPEGLKQPAAYERFLREAQAARKLQSKHVVRVYDFGQLPSGEPYIVMEFLVGEDVHAHMKKHGRLSVEDTSEYISQTCDALAEAHEAGIVHRDLKPANLFLVKGRGGRSFVKVLDFGIAKMAPAHGQQASKEITGDMKLGTVLYMSPEQLRSTRDVDPRADIWSIGVILYKLVTSVSPFQAEGIGDIIDKIFRGTPPPPSSLNVAIPPAFDAIVMKCLEKDPDQRFRSADEIMAALEPFWAPPPARSSVPRPTREPTSEAATSELPTKQWSGSTPLPEISRSVPSAKTPLPGTSSIPVLLSAGNETPVALPGSRHPRHGVLEPAAAGPIVAPAPSLPQGIESHTAAPWSKTGPDAQLPRARKWIAFAAGLAIACSAIAVVWVLYNRSEASTQQAASSSARAVLPEPPPSAAPPVGTETGEPKEAAVKPQEPAPGPLAAPPKGVGGRPRVEPSVPPRKASDSPAPQVTTEPSKPPLEQISKTVAPVPPPPPTKAIRSNPNDPLNLDP